MSWSPGAPTDCYGIAVPSPLDAVGSPMTCMMPCDEARFVHAQSACCVSNVSSRCIFSICIVPTRKRECYLFHYALTTTTQNWEFSCHGYHFAPMVFPQTPSEFAWNLQGADTVLPVHCREFNTRLKPFIKVYHQFEISEYVRKKKKMIPTCNSCNGRKNPKVPSMCVTFNIHTFEHVKEYATIMTIILPKLCT